MRKIFLLAIGLTFAACDGGSDPTDPNAPRLTLSADSVAIAVGASSQVTATVVNSTAAAQFLSRDTTVARVSGSGAITGVSAGRTVVVGSLTGNAAVRDSVVVVVSIPAPVQLPVLGTGMVPERFTAEVAVAEPFAYTTTWFRRALTDGNAIKIWNVTGNTPILVDSLIIAGAGTVSDVQISSDGALLVASTERGGNTNGIVIFDRSTPAKPTLIKRFITATTQQGVHTVKLSRINGRHYAFLAINQAFVNQALVPAKLAIVDLTDPANPVEIFVGAMGNPFVHDVFVRDGILFAALWDDGLTIFDVGGAGRGGSPSSPLSLGNVRTSPCSTCGSGSRVHNVWWFHDPTNNSRRFAFIGEEGPANTGAFSRASGAMHVVDVSNFNDPREVAVYEPDSTTTTTGQSAGAHNFVMDEQSGILYAAFYNGGVRALDVRGDLSSCTTEQKTNGLCNLRLMGREVGVTLN
ncbi:MAG: Ig-like domain-containing protein, partial [Gemmatimonadota bacterium]